MIFCLHFLCREPAAVFSSQPAPPGQSSKCNALRFLVCLLLVDLQFSANLVPRGRNYVLTEIYPELTKPFYSDSRSSKQSGQSSLYRRTELTSCLYFTELIKYNSTELKQYSLTGLWKYSLTGLWSIKPSSMLALTRFTGKSGEKWHLASAPNNCHP